MYDSLTEPQPGQGEKVITIISAEDSWKRKVISTKNIKIKQLLRPVFIDGVRTGASEPLQKLRERTTQNMASFDPAIFRFDNPHAYAAGLSQALFERREMMRVHEFEKTKVRLSSVNNNGTGGSKPNGLEGKP